MTGNEVRSIFLNYFAKQGHKIVKSSPLLPANDPTLLFTNAGMNQFKDVFIGAETREYKRATTSQKCIRAGGKHNDLDEVGKTARHHTFFEMLGNFSFGDYFKEDAIKFAWELLVDEYKLDPTRLWFSVFEGDAEVPADDEAVELWVKVGAPRERVLKFGRKDNFWQMGETGPCGPCSEIHYYMGDKPEDPAFNKAEYVNGAGDDTVEIWNLVFMQYNRSEIAPGQYKLDPLPAPSVDTGMGLERVSMVLQGVKTNYDTDLIKPIIEFTAKLSGKEYKADTQEGFAMRVVADHARSTAFAIADGILPSNEGRNYVLRKIMRRAIYQGRNTLGIGEAFFYKVCEFVIEQMQDVYPELAAHRGYIEKMVRLEEGRFISTLTEGAKRFEEQERQIIGESIEKALESVPVEVSEETLTDGYVLGTADSYQTNKAYIIDREKSTIKRLEIEMSDGTRIVKSFDELSNDEKQEAVRAAEVYRSSKPVREAYERIRPVLLHREKIRPIIEEYEKIRPQIEEIEKGLQKIRELHSLEKSLPQLERLNAARDLIEITKVVKSFASLYDTYGFPQDLIRIGLEKHGFQIDEEQFSEVFAEALQELQHKGVNAKAEGKANVNPVHVNVSKQHGKSEFKGYETTTVQDAKVIALIKADETAQALQAGDEGEVVLQQTPFYAESGGQVGDIGQLLGENLSATVLNTTSPVQGLIVHKIKVDKGNLTVGDEVVAQVDVEKRDSTRRNHTATHLMHAALREVLGTHVKQAGSIVAPDYLRFDFSHYQPLTNAEIEEIENLVNYHVLRNEPVQTDVLAIEDAMRSGAMALFGEKYGEKVRVLTVNGMEGVFSKELCGGTHVRATGDIGSFKITSDEAIASGTRRIRAVTGKGAFERFQASENLLAEAAAKINAAPAKLPAELERLQSQLREQQKEIERLKLKLAQGGGGSDDQVTEINGIKLLVRKVEGLGKEGRRQLADSLSRKIAPGVVVIADVVDGKASLLVMVSDDAIAKVKAGNVIKQIPGARGGGKPDLAEGGVETDQLEAALKAIPQVIERMLQT